MDGRRHHQQRRHGHKIDGLKSPIQSAYKQEHQRQGIQRHEAIEDPMVTGTFSRQIQEAVDKQYGGHPRKDAHEMHRPKAQPRGAIPPRNHPLVSRQKQLRQCHANQKQHIQQIRPILHGEVQHQVVKQHDQHDPRIKAEEHVAHETPLAQVIQTGHTKRQGDLLARFDPQVNLVFLTQVCPTQRKLGEGSVCERLSHPV